MGLDSIVEVGARLHLDQPIVDGERADLVVAQQLAAAHRGKNQVIAVRGRRADLVRADRSIDEMQAVTLHEQVTDHVAGGRALRGQTQ